jgi:hypothetical protein
MLIASVMSSFDISVINGPTRDKKRFVIAVTFCAEWRTFFDTV